MNLVLIIGAGATKDLYTGFGLGAELLQKISESLADKLSPLSTGILGIINEGESFDYSDLWQFSLHLNTYKQNATSPSIDEFLSEIETFPEYKSLKQKFITIGIISIMYYIIKWENELCAKFIYPHHDLTKVTWMKNIIDLIEEYQLLEDSPKHSLQIVTFNYDRSIDYILHQFYRQRRMDVDKWINNNIFHVYGKIAPINEFAVGVANIDFLKILNLKNSIQTIYNNRGVEEKRDLFKPNGVTIRNASVKDVIINSDVIAAFGFNFDYFNCRKIGIDNFQSTKKFIANIFPEKDDGFQSRRETSNRLRKMIQNIDLQYLTCKDFLEYVIIPK